MTQKPRVTLILAAVLMVSATLVAMLLLQALLQHTPLTSGGMPHDLRAFLQDAAMAAQLRGAGHALPNDTLPYPPPFLLLTTPFSWLPAHWVFAAWLLAGNAALVLAARALKLPWPAVLLTLASPVDIFCMAQAQTGLFVSAALLAGLGLAETQPVIAGIAAGCIIIKPQFGLLLPICYLAMRNWRAFAAAAAATAVLCLLPTLIFGPGVWRLFFGQHVAGAQSLINSNWPQDYQLTMVTVFVMCRSLHAGLTLSGGIQAAVSLAAAVAAWLLWQPGRKTDPSARLAATLCLVMLATPYAYIYDLPALTLAVATLAIAKRPGSLAVIALFWLITAVYGWISIFTFVTGALFLTALLIFVWPEKRRGLAA